ncbi:MAG TPA: response regulator [Caulobacteraceae bacterium]|jgi:signal transduction histidine kinase/CheY-like chemotaxis protein|nr:response regulator [Caulobacteraceae bacterium]
MTDAIALLHALDRPAALVDATGAVRANPAFDALSAAERTLALAQPPAPGWRSAEVGPAERLVSATSDAAARLTAQERFLATLSHEIRTPLNGVLGMTGLLERTRLDATQKDYLSALRNSGEHLLGLVNDVLDFAKLDAGRVELEPAPTDVERLLQGVCELLSPRANAAGVEIAWAAQVGIPQILADDGRLRQILFNLAGNAVKMTKAGGVLLTVEPRPAKGKGLRLRFCVRDTGPGLSREAQGQVFEEFVQTEEGVRAGGTGLGLAIVKRLVKAFGGLVGVESEPGKGACFWFEASFEAAGAGEGVGELAGLTVAVASASAIVREAAVRQVEACGATALSFETMAEAEARAPAGVVVLVDPPELGRSRLAAAPKSHPALVLLAPEARSRIARYRAAGYAGYLIKPLRRSSLAARVLAVLSERGVAPAARGPAAEDERAAPAGACGARVLLAEDNPVNALLAKALLGREGCAVERVATGEEALEALAAAPFDVILMDMRMPVMDGIEATRRLRALGVKTPIVALTANAFEDDRRACLEAGMDDFLTKPIEPAALRAALARWTSCPQEAKLAS